MKAIERLILRRKLASLRSAFPHDNDSTELNIANIYIDVMEFSRSIIIYFSTRNAYRNSSRPGLYPESCDTKSMPTSNLVQGCSEFDTYRFQ